jgi:curli production assembly/transport component CsgG
MRFHKSITVVVTGILFSGCATMFRHPMKTANAELGAKTEFYEELTSLPKPGEKIVAAVYKFRDQTGQYKPTETGASWSTAVTQGATSILIEAMEESGWFIPIEREGLGNLLNERKIIRSSRAQYQGNSGDDQSLLPPLLFAGVILEGGIISFDSNIMTGGAGLRYFGAGASGQYREDRVTIYLRAVSTSNGRILKTVYISKTILSQKLDVGFFRFVKFKRLLEAETGYTYNEPSEIAVKEAIEKAVQSLIIEGIVDNLWELENPKDEESKVITSYLEERALSEQTDYLGLMHAERRKFFSVGLLGGGYYFEGDYPGAEFQGQGKLTLGFNQAAPLSFNLNVGRGGLGGPEYFNSTINFSEVTATYRLFNDLKFSPYFSVGSGVMSMHNKQFFNVDLRNKAYFYLTSVVGYEHLLTRELGVSISLSNNILFEDSFDRVSQGAYTDFYWGLQVGVNYYFNFLK